MIIKGNLYYRLITVKYRLLLFSVGECNIYCSFLAVFSDSEYLDTPSSKENGFFILLRQPRLFVINGQLHFLPCSACLTFDLYVILY